MKPIVKMKIVFFDAAVNKLAFGHTWMPTSHCRPEGISGGRKELNMSGLAPL